jgi:hypothetical protein
MSPASKIVVAAKDEGATHAAMTAANNTDRERGTH